MAVTALAWSKARSPFASSSPWGNLFGEPLDLVDALALRPEDEGVEALLPGESGQDCRPLRCVGTDRVSAGRPPLRSGRVGDGADQLGDTRDLAGSRPAARAASSIVSCAPGQASYGRYEGIGAAQPSPRRPVTRNALGPSAPTQIPIGCAGTGPAAARCRR